LPLRAQDLDIRAFEEVSPATLNEHRLDTQPASPLSSSTTVRQAVRRLPRMSFRGYPITP
jgi:hypothetical protein